MFRTFARRSHTLIYLFQMKFIAIIPARYASTRFPAKPLAMLGGKTVIQRVYEQVGKVLPEAWVATDDARIFNAVEDFGGKAVMTKTDHKSGTDRIEEAAEKIATDADVIINIQGDEPFIQPSQIETICRQFDDTSTQIATLGKPFASIDEVKNPNSPKIVMDVNGFALYFSRSVIPFVGRQLPIPQAFGNICLPPPGFKGDYTAATVSPRACREPRTTALAAERLPHKGGYNQRRDRRNRHS